MPRGYGRALLKISGEAFAGREGHGLDRASIASIAAQIARAAQADRRLGVVIGGGNILRGKDAASVGVSSVVADQMGMVATVLNAMALTAALETEGTGAVAVSAFPVGRFVETFDRSRVLDLLDRGRVVVFAGGTGNPCFTTDSAAALRAVEIQAEVLIKGTQVPGVYDKDPKEHSDAVFFETISPAELVKRGLRVIDAAAADILARYKIPAIVLDLHVEGNIEAALAGERIGTLIV